MAYPETDDSMSQSADYTDQSSFSRSSSDEEYASADNDAHWSYGVNSLNSINLVPKNGNYKTFKEQLRRYLRVGSAYHIGSCEFPLTSAPHGDGESATSLDKRNGTTTLRTAQSFIRHPFNLLLAREHGHIGPSSKSKRLCYRASLWRVEGSQRIDGLQFRGNRSRGAFYPDPQTFQESIQGSLWAVTRLHLENKFKCHRGCVNTLCFSSTGNLIASGSDDLKIVLTNWVTEEQVAKFDSGHCLNIFHVKFLPLTNDTKIVSCACDSEVRLAELATDGSLATPTRLLVSHNRSCHRLALPTGEPNIVLSAGADGQVFSIDVRIAKAENILWLPFSEFFSIASNPVYPNEFAVCGRSESIVRIYDRRKIDSRDPRSGYLHCFGVDHLRSTGSLTSSVVLDANNPRESVDRERPDGDSETDSEVEEDSSSFLNSLSAQLGRRVRAVLSGLRGRADVAFSFTDGSRDSARSHPSYNLESSKYSVTAAVYSNQGDALLASYNDEDIYLFDVRHPSRPYLHKYTGHRNMQTIVSATFFGPNSEYVVSGSDDGFFYIWDRESEGITQWLHADANGAVNVIESHPTLPVLASAGLDYDFKVWSPLRPISEDTDALYSNHFKYTSGKVAPTVRRLRKSRLAKALFGDAFPACARSSNEGADCHIIQDNESRTNAPLPTSSPGTDPLSINILSSTTDGLRDTADVSVDSNHSVLIRKRPHRSSSPSEDSTVCGAVSASLSGDMDDPSLLSDRGHRRGRKHPKCRVASSSQTSSLPPDQSDVFAQSDISKVNPLFDQSRPDFPPQSLLPFNRRDLELRVAQNWINRTGERSQLDGLAEADSRILSAIESVAQFHARTVRRQDAVADALTDTSESSDGDHSNMLGSFILLRRPNCPVERSETTLRTRDFSNGSSVTSASVHDTLNSCSFSSGNTELVNADSDANPSVSSSPSSRSSWSSSSKTTLQSTSSSSSSSSSTLSSPSRSADLHAVPSEDTAPQNSLANGPDELD